MATNPNPIRKKGSAASTSDVPQGQITVVDNRFVPEAIAHGMDVGRVHAVLRSAETGDTRDLFALYRDVIMGCAHLQAEFSKRKLAVLGDPMSFQPFDKKNPNDTLSSDSIRSMVTNCKAWRLACSHLLDSCLYPVSIVEKVFAPAGVGDKLTFTLKALVPVPHHLLDFTTGKLRIHDTNIETGEILSTTHEPDHARYIVHRGHILSAPDNWGGPMRSIIFWWLLATMDREWWARFLDRYGSPFLLGTYPRGDKDSRDVLERAFALSVKLGGLVISEDTKVELARAEGASAVGQAYSDFIKVCHAEMSKLILGQTLSAEASPTGELGGGTANMQSGVRDDIRMFDATLLSETLRDQLFRQYIMINGLGGGVPSIVFGSASADDVRATVELLQAIRETDVEVTDAAIASLSERTGLELQRRATPVGPGSFSIQPFSADSRRSRHNSADLSRAVRDGAANLAPLLRTFPDAVAAIISDSNSASECQERITALYADTDRRRSAAVLADALAVHAALGAARVRDPSAS